jgi:hypothetical protein
MKTPHSLSTLRFGSGGPVVSGLDLRVVDVAAALSAASATLDPITLCNRLAGQLNEKGLHGPGQLVVDVDEHGIFDSIEGGDP